MPGKLVQIVFVDLYVLNYDGNLIDACGVGALAALLGAKRPTFAVVDGVGKPTGEKEPLIVRKKPIPISVIKIGDSFLLDPTGDEEDVMSARLTVTTDEDGNVVTMQKSGSEGLSLDDVKKCINMAAGKAAEIRAKATGEQQ